MIKMGTMQKFSLEEMKHIRGRAKFKECNCPICELKFYVEIKYHTPVICGSSDCLKKYRRLYRQRKKEGN
jgi:hypothetical protein